jgi:hypothetical protein
MILVPIVCALWYCAGELWSKFIKYCVGIPIAGIALLTGHGWLTAIFIIASYAIATQFGYGENNWLTKLLGNRGAITFCGLAIGLASWPVLGFFAILQALLSAGAWCYLSILDDNGTIKEPFVGLIRGFSAAVLLVFA